MPDTLPDTTIHVYTLSLERVGAKRLASALRRLPELPGYAAPDASRVAHGEVHRSKVDGELDFDGLTDVIATADSSGSTEECLGVCLKLSDIRRWGILHWLSVE